MNYRISFFFAELVLKGNNRKLFAKRLRQNIARKLKVLGYTWPIHSAYDRVFLQPDINDETLLCELLKQFKHVPGIAKLTLGYCFTKDQYRGIFGELTDMTPVYDKIQEVAKQSYSSGLSFAVRAKRSDKRFPMTSMQIEKSIADVILKNSQWHTVNLKHPDHIFHIDVSTYGVVIDLYHHKGSGGLPVSITGKVLSLLSGGFDSPVAAWLMANRGCNVDCIHFSASHIQRDKIKDYKVSRIAQKLSETIGKLRLVVVPFTHYDVMIDTPESGHDAVLFRRFMVRVSEAYIGSQNLKMLVNGDNLGQVASQTMSNMVALDKSANMSIMRPLLTFNKQEIISLSRKLGLYELCAEPHKDCCALISDQPKTKSTPGFIDHIENKLIENYPQLIKDTLKDRIEITYYFGRTEKIETGF